MKKSQFLRRVLSLFCGLAVMFAAVPASASSMAQTTEYVNFRAEASLSGAVIDVLDPGTTVTVVDSGNPEWTRVTVSDGTQGYIYSRYLDLYSSSGSGGGNAVVTADVNFRTGPSTDTYVIDVLGSGTAVTILDTGNPEWTRVSAGGREGYIYAQYIRANGETPPPEPETPTISEPYTATAYVNVRSGPGTGYSVITLVDEGTGVTVTDKSKSPWFAVTLASGSKGYIHSDYLKAKEAEPAPPAEEISEPYTATAYVNVRAGAGTSYSVITLLDEGTGVTVTNKSKAPWFAVTLANGSKGYIHSDYLRARAAEPAPPTEDIQETYKATAYVNVRSGPGTDYSVITLVDEGTSVTVTNKSKAPWFAVTLSSGSKGYMHSDYLRASSAQPSPDGSVKAVTTASVNLRNSAGTYARVIDVLSSNTIVTVTEAPNSQWYKVRLSGGAEGYVSAGYLDITAGDAGSLPSNPNYYAQEAEREAGWILDAVGYDLYAAYKWSAFSMPYQSLSFSSADGYDPAQWYALYGFHNGSGNCYVMANTFYQMAKVLGYDAHCVEGYVRSYDGSLGPHGWVEIDMNGGTYVFDPEFQHQYGRNGYQINYGDSGTFQYADWHRIN